MLGRVKEIWRYPVKGMAGEALQSCALTPKGLVGDRLWAVRDCARNEIQSCKFRPDLLRIGASLAWDDERVSLSFPDGEVLSSDSPDLNAAISLLIGNASMLEALSAQHDLAAFKRYKKDEHGWLDELKATFEREVGEPLPDFTDLSPNIIDYVSLPGSYFLVSPFHLLTTASLNYLQGLQPEGDWDVRRFRPNLVIDTLSSEPGLIEQSWLGGQLQVGDAALSCTTAAPRCGAITRAQQQLPVDSKLLRTVVREADQNVGIYADTLQPGMLRVGDPVYLRS
ncbi:MAG: MOSC N-terminal beta barrel domain-containing protein [Halopseudomonas sabulinigri]